MRTEFPGIQFRTIVLLLIMPLFSTHPMGNGCEWLRKPELGRRENRGDDAMLERLPQRCLGCPSQILKLHERHHMICDYLQVFGRRFVENRCRYLLLKTWFKLRDIGEWNVAGSRKASTFQQISNESSNSFATLRL